MNLDRVIAAVLGAVPAATREHFAADPLQALRSLGLVVEAVDGPVNSRADGGLCDGTSFLRDGVVLYRPSPNSRRENFTLGHELGHYLVDQDHAVMDWLADQDDPMVQLETICDRIAQALLLPDHRVREHTSKAPIGARTILDLYDATQASRPACAITIAGRLPHLGAAVLLDPTTATVTFASIHPDPDRGWPTVFPWTGQPVPAGHPLKSLEEGGTLTRKSFWENTWGSRSTFYIDALHDGRRIIAVFSATDLWNCEVLHLDVHREFIDRPTRTVTCCGTRHEVRGWPCSNCDGGYCPTCRRCRCQKADDTEQPCQRCYLRYRPQLLVSGLCEECR